MDQSLFDKYGGFAKVSRIVLALYDRLLEDDDIGPFFEGVDMARVVDHQTKFVSSLLGGPASYSDAELSRMHRHLAINSSHFDILKKHLELTLQEHGMSGQDIDLVVGAFEQRRNLVVS